jgi:Ran GTPase-activating protein (RanGAP) involved in mRNA processing and transport
MTLIKKDRDLTKGANRSMSLDGYPSPRATFCSQAKVKHFHCHLIINLKIKSICHRNEVHIIAASPKNMTVGEWSLSDAQRTDTIARVRANMSSLAFFRGQPLSPDTVNTAAIAAEKKAYTVAKVEARTTTGVRPHSETLKAYVRKLSALVIEVVNSGGGGPAPPPQRPHAEEELDLSGAREFLTRDTAEELLAPMLAEGAKIRRIKFSTKSFGIEAAQVAAKAIRNVASTLKEADLSDIIAGRPEDEALGALRIISEALGTAELHVLNLSDNALGEKGIRACLEAYKNQAALEAIAFQNVGASVHGCAALAETLLKTTALKKFHLLNNMSGDEGARSIAQILVRCPAMEDFKMASSRVGSEGGIALAKALESAGSQLKSLDLHDNPMTEEVAPHLGALIRRHADLETLNLNDTCLGDDGTVIIAEALFSAAPNLERLEMELNEITASGARPLGEALSRKARLRTLNLRENDLEDDGALFIARALSKNTNIEVVDLCTNQIRRGGACALAKAVVASPNLQLLALDDNEISEAGVEALKSILKAGDKLHVLGSLDENCPDDDDEEEGGEEGEEEDGSGDAAVDALADELRREHL